MRRRGIRPFFAKRGVPHRSGLGKNRWQVERFFAWLRHFGRLRVRTDQFKATHGALYKLAMSLICLTYL